MTINQLIKQAHKTASEKGWWKEERSFIEIAALIHSEVSEAVEEFRNKRADLYYSEDKPEGILIELADVVIRIADYCGYMGWDLESSLKAKMSYNKTRPYRHGGKKA